MVLKLVVLLTSLIIGLNLFASTSLNFISAHFLKSDLEVSGLTYHQEKLYLVADDKKDHFVFQGKLEAGKLIYFPTIDLMKIPGFKYYFYISYLKQSAGGHFFKSPLDLEGVFSCQDKIFLANEQMRHVFKIEKETFHLVKLPSLFKKNSVNAGIEGLAVDCKRNILFVSQERDPRKLWSISLSNHSFEEIPLPAGHNNDIADLYYESDHLYILERNHYKILKYSIEKKKIVDSASFASLGTLLLKDLYDSDPRYGQAEGLTMNREVILIGVDNNGDKVSAAGKKIFGSHENHSVILKFKRPQNW